MRARCNAAVRQLRLSRTPVAPVWRHKFEAHRAAFEHGLQLVDAPIALSQTLDPAEAVGRAITHAKLFQAEPAVWCIVDQPELSASGSALRAAKVGPRAAARELRMRDADEFGLLAERCVGPSVLKPNQARGFEARYADPNKFIEESARIRIDPAFWHKLKLPLAALPSVRYHSTTGNRDDHLGPQQS
jgi:hypothetical protein